MATLEIPVRLNWTGASGSPGASIWHFRSVGSDIGQSSQNGVNAVMNFFNDIRSLFPTTWTASFDGTVYGVGDNRDDTYSATYAPVTGTGSNDYLPPALAICVTMRGASRSRTALGRKFFSPLTASVAQDNGTPTETARGELQGAFENLLGFNEGENNGAVGIYSKKTDTFFDMTRFTVPNEFATLRSRRD